VPAAWYVLAMTQSSDTTPPTRSVPFPYLISVLRLDVVPGAARSSAPATSLTGLESIGRGRLEASSECSPITFRSFRHGGFTAAGDADFSDADTSAVCAKTEATLDVHRKGTMHQRRRALTRLLDERSE
jgi:hypothetical protein